MSGVLSIALLAALLLLLFPEELEEKFIPIVKLAMGIWIIHSVFSLFGHSFL